ncbi:MAG: phosphatase PAP2 family protein [Phycisphaerales bacterium]
MTTPRDDHRPAPHRPRAPLAARPTLIAITALAALAIAHPLDPIIMSAVETNDHARTEWARALRALGYLPTWFTIAIAFLLIDWKADRWRRALFTAAAPVLAGIVAEIAKLIIRRARPPEDDALRTLDTWPGHIFIPFTETPFSTSGVGMPSGHAAVAFGGMLILCHLHPRATILWLALATGTAYTRLLSHAHYFSDTILAAILAWATVAAITRFDPARPSSLDPIR